jgi:hypothetical protein
MLETPQCEGMIELAYTEPERALLRVAASTCPREEARLQLADDIVQYHILQGLAVTAGSAFGEAIAPDRQTCWKLFTAIPPRPDNQSTQIHVGGKAFTKHSHRDSSGWWGTSNGTNANKNKLAEACFDRIWATSCYSRFRGPCGGRPWHAFPKGQQQQQ